MLSKPVGKTTASFTNVKFAGFVAGNATNDVGGGASEVMLNNEIRFRSRNKNGGIQESARVAMCTRARKVARQCG